MPHSVDVAWPCYSRVSTRWPKCERLIQRSYVHHCQLDCDTRIRAFLRESYWWGKLDESYRNSSKDVIMNTSIVA